MAPGYLPQRLIVPETKKSEPCYRGADFLWSAKRGRGLALRRRAAKRRAYGEEHTPCAIAILYRKVEVRTFLLNIVFNLVNELGKVYGDGIHLTVAHKREWSYGFKPDNKTVPLPC
ncbi:hypothetical protein, partial [Aeromonas sp. R1-1]|uniref:hypothetical protein n=1 Tax=Aeromonas sp. R1-1 TaxID=3138455 RepID=UPI0034A4EA17